MKMKTWNITGVAEGGGAHVDAKVMHDAPAIEVIHELDSRNISRGYENMETSEKPHRSQQHCDAGVIHNHTCGANGQLYRVCLHHGLQPWTKIPVAQHDFARESKKGLQYRQELQTVACWVAVT
jgi:hypothetical protein